MISKEVTGIVWMSSYVAINFNILSFYDQGVTAKERYNVQAVSDTGMATLAVLGIEDDRKGEISCFKEMEVKHKMTHLLSFIFTLP